MVKNLPAMQETGFDPWVGKIPLEEGMATHSMEFLPGESPWIEEPGGCSPWGLKESDTTERLSTAQSILERPLN